MYVRALPVRGLPVAGLRPHTLRTPRLLRLHRVYTTCWLTRCRYYTCDSEGGGAQNNYLPTGSFA